jgi:DtxR family transcriptional regulator, Mn-dependent transcriptional regulator
MRTSAKKNSEMSATKEDYVRAIYILGQNDQDVGVMDIARRLKLSKSTVSERIKELIKEDLAASEPYSPVKLTKKGEMIGAKLTYKHRLVEVFLHRILKVPKNQVHLEAEKLEHALSDDVVKRLAKFLDYPTNDPHGSSLPKIKNWN